MPSHPVQHSYRALFIELRDHLAVVLRGQGRSRKHLAASAPLAKKALEAETLIRLPTSYYTLAEAFKADGYATAHFGKWHLGPKPPFPLQAGQAVAIVMSDEERGRSTAEVNEGDDRKSTPIPHVGNLGLSSGILKRHRQLKHPATPTAAPKYHDTSDASSAALEPE